MTKLLLGADHRGFELKNQIYKYLVEKYDVQDLGAFEYNLDDDYPDIAFEVCQKVVENDAQGILICGSSFGVTVAANKVRGIIATNPDNIDEVEQDRKHHGGNVLCLAADLLDFETATKIVDLWMTTEYEGGRHERRLNKIRDYERNN